MAEKYDLTTKVGVFMDRHLVFPLLEFLQVQNIYDEREIIEAKIELLSKTNMVDFAMDMHKSLHQTEDVPEGMIARREVVVENLKQLQVDAEKVVNFLSNPNLVNQLRAEKAYNLELLEREYEISTKDIETLYSYAKFQFECGNYSAATEFLAQFRNLSLEPEKCVNALWGKFASDILMQLWDMALEDMARLKEQIDAQTEEPLMQLQQRTWLMHWSLFVFFNHENGRNSIVDLFMQDRYMNAIQTTSHHLLRYLAAAVITNRKRRNVLKDLVRVLEQEHHNYADPITEFLECLFVHYDFEGAQEKLRECEDVLANDFFLVGCRDEFIENSRLFMFEMYCRIHKVIDIKMLASKLNMNSDEAERWVVNLIRSAKLNAKIDSEAGTVVMGTQHPSIYEQLVEKTKNASFRTFQLSNSLLDSVQQAAN